MEQNCCNNTVKGAFAYGTVLSTDIQCCYNCGQCYWHFCVYVVHL